MADWSPILILLKREFSIWAPELNEFELGHEELAMFELEPPELFIDSLIIMTQSFIGAPIMIVW